MLRYAHDLDPNQPNAKSTNESIIVYCGEPCCWHCQMIEGQQAKIELNKANHQH